MRTARQPPVVGGRLVVKNALRFSRDPFGSLEHWARTDDVVRVDFPGESFYLVSRPELVGEVLHDPDERFRISDEQRDSFEGIQDHALTSADGDRWRRLRRALHPAFTLDAIERYGSSIVEKTRERVNQWETGERIDLHREMRLLTVHVVADTLLAVDIEGREEIVLEAADAFVDRTDPRRPGQLLPDWVPTPTERRFARSVDRLETLVGGALDAHGQDGSDAISVMLGAVEAGTLSLDEVRHNMVALLLAGSDTTALALTYCWYLLDRHPAEYERLVDECASVIGPDRPGPEHREQLQHLQHVVDETMRLYPPTWATFRTTREAVELGEFAIPGGGTLMLSQWVVHRDPRLWEDPESFDPSRWASDQDRPEHAFFPFSAGPRHCLGMNFARLELHLALATMIGQVHLDVSVDEPLSVAPAASLRPETAIMAKVDSRAGIAEEFGQS